MDQCSTWTWPKKSLQKDADWPLDASMQISFQILSRFFDFVDIMQLCGRVAEGSERMVASS